MARVLDLMLAGQTTLDQRIEQKQTITETRYICEYVFMYKYIHKYIQMHIDICKIHIYVSLGFYGHRLLVGRGSLG